MRAAPLLCLLLLAIPPAAGIAADAPDGVLVAPYDLDSVLVSWTPDQAGATYRIYGEATNGALVLLAETPELHSIVDTGYATYSVATIVNGELVRVRTSEIPCVTIVHGIPPEVVIYDCGPERVSIRRPL